MIFLHGFFEQVRKGRLTAIRCSRCATLAIPPRDVCPGCGQREWEPVPLDGIGTITSFTVIRVPPRGQPAETPYAVALVRLREGVSLQGRIVDIPVHALTVGQTVRFRPLVEAGRTAIGFGPAA